MPTLRTLPVGDGIRLLDNDGTRAVVHLRKDYPKGAGPLTIATLSGPAFTSIPPDPWSTALWRECLAVLFPCFVGCEDVPGDPQWPWFRLMCDTCHNDAPCGHVRALVDTIPAMRGRCPPGTCGRMAAFPTRDLGGSIADGEAERCAVCFEVVPEGAALACCSCEHRFHRACIAEWVEVGAHPSCPLCRATWPVGLRWVPMWAV